MASALVTTIEAGVVAIIGNDYDSANSTGIAKICADAFGSKSVDVVGKTSIEAIALAIKRAIDTVTATIPDAVIEAGALFPVSPADNQLFYHTKLRDFYYYDAFALLWLSVTEHELVLAPWLPGNTSHSATVDTTHLTAAPFSPTGQIFLTRWIGDIYIEDANDDMNHWIVGLAPSSGVNFSSFNVGTPVSLSAGWNRVEVTDGLGLRSVTSDQHYMQTLAKVAAASNCNLAPAVVHYRLVG